MTEHGTGAFGAVPSGDGGNGRFGMGQFHGDGREDSRTLVVDREDGDRYHGGRYHGGRSAAAASPSWAAGCSARGCSSWW